MEPSVDPLTSLDFEIREPRWWVRPVLIRLGLLAVIIGATLLLWDEHAEAHTGIGLTVSSDGHGSVLVVAQWRDGHAVTDALGATLTATSDGGQRVGPVPLRPAGQRPGVVAYTGALGPGGWSVVVDVGTPGIARCTAKLTVAGQDGASVAPTSVVCPAPPADPAVAVGGSAAAGGSGPAGAAGGGATVSAITTGADAGSDAGTGRRWISIAAVGGVLAVTSLLLLRRARRQPVPLPASRRRR